MNKKDEKVFVDGAYVETPNENLKNKAPFIIANINFDANQFGNFIKKHKNNRGTLCTTLKESKAGKLYLELNTWQPKGVEQKEGKVQINETLEETENDMINRASAGTMELVDETIDPNDLEF